MPKPKIIVFKKKIAKNLIHYTLSTTKITSLMKLDTCHGVKYKATKQSILGCDRMTQIFCSYNAFEEHLNN